MTDAQIVAAIATILQLANGSTEPSVDVVASRYKKNLREAKAPKDPNKTTLDDVDEAMRP